MTQTYDEKFKLALNLYPELSFNLLISEPTLDDLLALKPGEELDVGVIEVKVIFDADHSVIKDWEVVALTKNDDGASS